MDSARRCSHVRILGFCGWGTLVGTVSRKALGVFRLPLFFVVATGVHDAILLEGVPYVVLWCA